LVTRASLATCVSISAAVRDALYGRMPSRYGEHPYLPLDRHLRALLVPGTRVLDVGSGRSPHIPVAGRSPGIHYAGLDVSEAELQAAPSGSYDETIIADIASYRSDLVERFDVITCFDVLEHVRSLDRAIENMRTYLCPGGRLVTGFSGRFSAFGLLNQVVPQRIGVAAMQRLFGRDPATVFPAHYNQCWYRAVERLLCPWSGYTITPVYWAGGYFRFLRPLQAVYIGYEEWAVCGRHRNLASHYIIEAIR